MISHTPPGRNQVNKAFKPCGKLLMVNAGVRSRLSIITIPWRSLLPNAARQRPHPVVRESGDNWPPSWNNSDRKIETATVNSTLTTVIKAGAHKSQKGFVKGGQLLQNAVDLDAFACSFGMHAALSNKGNTDCTPIRIAILAFFRLHFSLGGPRVAFHCVGSCWRP